MSQNVRQIVIDSIEKEKIIAIIRGYAAETSMKISQALYDGGIRLVEIPFNNAHPERFPETEQAIAAIRSSFEGKMLVGAGTVTGVALAERAAAAGAQFIVSPDMNENVIKRTIQLGMVSIPGAMSPTEIIRAHDCGADYVKLFPARELGLSYVKAIVSPINHVKLIAVGGIGEENLKAFLASGIVGAGIGGTLINKQHIKEGRFDKLTDAAARIVAIAKESGAEENGRK